MVYLPQKVLESMLCFCRTAGRQETGGVLVGHYAANGRIAELTGLCGPPPDSVSGPTVFKRGTAGLRNWLQQLWSQPERRYYLGEWHFHPNGLPQPSCQDVMEMASISKQTSYQCINPLLIIIGGKPPKNWNVGVYVANGSVGMLPLDKSTSAIEVPEQQDQGDHQFSEGVLVSKGTDSLADL
jgi:integrative and conjugative element protein (TIGR02256 family)